MNKYEKGQIYLIKCKETGLGYVGSTIDPLRVRLSKHRTDFRGYYGFKDNKLRNYRSSFDVMESDEYEIHLLEKYPCNERKELLKREALWILCCSATMTLTNKLKPYKLEESDLCELINLNTMDKQHLLNIEIENDELSK